jgi:hypothetical protein
MSCHRFPKGYVLPCVQPRIKGERIPLTIDLLCTPVPDTSTSAGKNEQNVLHIFNKSHFNSHRAQPYLIRLASLLLW